ncbi:MAG TPA: hypothetical protein VJ476_02495 [Rhizomicrobium sp.]|nr:hypothetical protein [Rhizomicrobium sp.]
MLRIWADFNSCEGLYGAGPCWCLGYGEKLDDLESVEKELGLADGLRVVLYPGEEDFEVTAVLEKDPLLNKWQARPDWTTFRRLKDD